MADFCIGCGALVMEKCQCIWSSVRTLQEKVKKLESENEMRKDTIGCIDQAYNDAYLNLEKRIIELESMKHDYYTAIQNNCANIVMIEKLEKTVNELLDKISDIANHYYKEKKTPHKCPVCDGTGNHTDQRARLMVRCKTGTGIICCESCEGKGIVWG